jgi:hypothetical protein
MHQILYGIATLIFSISIPYTLYKISKNKTELKTLAEQRRIKELELESQNNQLKLLEEENKKYDRLIKRAQDARH